MINKRNTIDFLFFLPFLLFLLFLRLLPLLLVAAVSEQVYATGAVGWHWYNEINEIITPEDKKPVQRQSKQLKQLKQLTAQEQMIILRQTVEEAKAKAILFPSEENVYAYLQLQNYVVGKAVVFSRVWQKTLLDYPDIDYSVLHPTENNAQHIVYEEEAMRENEAIAVFREKYGLFFFYRGNNALDRELAPTVESFVQENHISLIPVSVDGKILPIFPNSRSDNGQAAQLGISYFPALVLVDPVNRIVKPLRYGFISQSELKRRFLQIATDFKEGI